MDAIKAKKHLSGLKMPMPAEEASPAVEEFDVAGKKKKKKKSAAGGEQWPTAQDSVMTTGKN